MVMGDSRKSPCPFTDTMNTFPVPPCLKKFQNLSHDSQQDLVTSFPTSTTVSFILECLPPPPRISRVGNS